MNLCPCSPRLEVATARDCVLSLLVPGPWDEECMRDISDRYVVLLPVMDGYSSSPSNGSKTRFAVVVKLSSCGPNSHFLSSKLTAQHYFQACFKKHSISLPVTQLSKILPT